MRIKLPKLTPAQWLKFQIRPVPKRKPKAQSPDLTIEEMMAITKPVASFLINPKASKPKARKR